MATFKSSGTNKDVKVQPTGTGAVKVGTGAAAAVVSSEGDHDLTLQTGNATTGTITITDGADGDISISPNGTGTVVVNTDLDVDNININGNSISSTNTNGDINLTPNGSGSAVISTDLNVDTVKPSTTNGSLSLKGDSGGSATANGISVDSSGNTSITGTITTSTASLDGAVTINESGADADFRVETSGKANALFVEGSSGKVGIGTNLPNEELHIETTGGDTAGIQLSTTGGTVERDWKFIVNSTAGTFFIQDATAITNRLAIDSSGNIGIATDSPANTLSVTGSANVDNIKIDGNTVSSTDTNGNINLTPNGTGKVVTDKADINGGTIDGTTLGSTVVFPAGHVIQTTQNTYNSGDSATTTSSTATKVSDGSSNYYWSHTISGMTAGNDVLVNFNFIGKILKNAASAGCSWHIYRDNTIIYTATDDYMRFISATGSTAIQDYSYINLVFLDTGATSASHTYYLGYSSYLSTNVTVISGANMAPFVAILQEIKS